MALPARIVVPEQFKDVKAWATFGERLAEVEHSVMWTIGEWWNAGDQYGRSRAKAIRSPDWKGPNYQLSKLAGFVVRRFPEGNRLTSLSFGHHQAVAPLADEQAMPLLEWAAQGEKGPRRVNELRSQVKKIRREVRERELGQATRQAMEQLGADGEVFNVIMADPPWRFEVRSENGMDRAAENHYPSMSTEAIKAMAVPSAEDAVLFLWATNPMLLDALDVMAEWGFDYKTNFVWTKESPGLGYWNRAYHEMLLVGTKGRIPAPAPGEQYDSVQPFDRLEHSEKPAGFYEMVEEMFPNGNLLELFGRRERLGWTVWGNEVPAQASTGEPGDAAAAAE